MPIILSIYFGPTPRPVETPPAVVLDEVTKGYVPWSISSNVPCAPSNKIDLSSLIQSYKRPWVSAEYLS